MIYHSKKKSRDYSRLFFFLSGIEHNSIDIFDNYGEEYRKEEENEI